MKNQKEIGGLKTTSLYQSENDKNILKFLHKKFAIFES